jgi:cytochrome c biogenesis protein CcdA
MSLAFAFLAGLLSILSPCVLPVLPLVLAPALASHRLGLPALALGVAAAYVAIGVFVATIGFSIGLDGDVFRAVAAGLLGLFGLLLLSGALQERFAGAAGGVGRVAGCLMGGLAPRGPGGQLVLGVLLGAVWSPCVGPTLGAASVLAAQRRDLTGVAAVMAAFGLGTALPLLGIGLLSRAALLRWRGRMLRAGQAGKSLLGAAAVAVAVLILTGADRAVETALVAASPGWLTALTTRF